MNTAQEMKKDLFSVVVDDAAEFIYNELSQCLFYAETLDSPENALSLKRLCQWLSGWVEVFSHYKFGDPKVHMLLYQEATKDPVIWEFIFGRLMTFINMTNSKLYELGATANPTKINDVVQRYYSANITSKFKPFGDYRDGEEVGNTYLLGPGECELMSVSPELWERLSKQQPWVIYFMFVMECAQMRNVQYRFAKHITETGASIPK